MSYFEFLVIPYGNFWMNIVSQQVLEELVP